MICKYTKVTKGFTTSCGFIINKLSPKWNYCPFCGKEIERPDNIITFRSKKNG